MVGWHATGQAWADMMDLVKVMVLVTRYKRWKLIVEFLGPLLQRHLLGAIGQRVGQPYLETC